MTTDGSQKIVDNVFKELRENNCQLRFFYLGKLLFRNEDKIKSFLKTESLPVSDHH